MGRFELGGGTTVGNGMLFRGMTNLPKDEQEAAIGAAVTAHRRITGSFTMPFTSNMPLTDFARKVGLNPFRPTENAT